MAEQIEERVDAATYYASPAHDTLEVWTLTATAFQHQGAYAPGARFKSAVLDTEVDVTAIFNV